MKSLYRPQFVIILSIIGSALTFAMLLLSDVIATAIDETATFIQTEGNTCN